MEKKTFMVDAKPGQSFAKQTLEGLVGARVLVAFCTADYGEKTGVGYETFVELRYAYENHLPIIPLKLCTVWPPQPPDLEGKAQNRIVFTQGLVYIEDIYMKAPKMVAEKIEFSLNEKWISDLENMLASIPGPPEHPQGYPKLEGRKEECEHDMQKLHVHMCYLYNGPKRGDPLEFLTCTKCDKTFHPQNRRELVTCAFDGNGKQYADKQKTDVKHEVEECERWNTTLEGQIQLPDGQNCRARLNFDGHTEFHPWLKVHKSNFVGPDTEFHIKKVNYQGNQVLLELDEPHFGGKKHSLKHNQVEFLMLG